MNLAYFGPNFNVALVLAFTLTTFISGQETESHQKNKIGAYIHDHSFLVLVYMIVVFTCAASSVSSHTLGVLLPRDKLRTYPHLYRQGSNLVPSPHGRARNETLRKALHAYPEKCVWFPRLGLNIVRIPQISLDGFLTRWTSWSDLI